MIPPGIILSIKTVFILFELRKRQIVALLSLLYHRSLQNSIEFLHISLLSANNKSEIDKKEARR